MERYQRNSGLRIFFEILIFLFIFIANSVLAFSYFDEPVALYNNISGKITVMGNTEERSSKVSVSIIKNQADVENLKSDDVYHTTDAVFSEDYVYRVDIPFFGNPDNYKIFVNTGVSGVYADINRDFGYKNTVVNFSLKLDKNIINVGEGIPFCLEAVMSDDSVISDFDSVEYIFDNNDVAEIVGENLCGLRQGSANLIAKAVINGMEISSNSVHFNVRDKDEFPEMNGVIFKENGIIKDSKGDISEIDTIELTFDREMKNDSFKGVNITNLKTKETSYYSGEYIEDVYRINLGKNLGYGFYKLEFSCVPQSEEGMYLINNSTFFGTDFLLSYNEKMFLNESCDAFVSLVNYHFGEIEKITDNIIFSVSDNNIASVSGNTISAIGNGATLLSAKFYRNGDLHEISKQVRCVAIDKIMPQLSTLDLSVGATAFVSVEAYDTDGNEIDLSDMEILYSSSKENIAKVDSYGKIYAVSIGKTNITVQIGDCKTEISLGVRLSNSDKITGYVIKASENNLKVGYGAVLQTECIYLSGLRKTVENLSYISSDSKIIEVTDRGIIAKKEGEAIVSAFLSGEEIAQLKIIATEETVVPKNSKDSENSSDSILYNGGILNDELNNTDLMYIFDQRLKNDGGMLYSSGVNYDELYAVYKLNGAVKEINIDLYTFKINNVSECISLYVSDDNSDYTIVCGSVTERETTLGWLHSVYNYQNIFPDCMYVKIVINNVNSNAMTVKIDNVEICYSDKPYIYSVDVVSGERDTEYINSNGQKAVIVFSQPVNPETLSAVTVDGQNVSGVYDINDCKYTVDLPDKNNKKYTLSVNGVQGFLDSGYIEEENYEISGYDNTYSMRNYKVCDIYREELNDITQECELYVEGTLFNETVFPKEYVILVAYEKNNSLSFLKEIKKGTVNPRSKADISEKVDFSDQYGSLKLFIWENDYNLKPITKKIELRKK